MDRRNNNEFKRLVEATGRQSRDFASAKATCAKNHPFTSRLGIYFAVIGAVAVTVLIIILQYVLFPQHEFGSLEREINSTLSTRGKTTIYQDVPDVPYSEDEISSTTIEDKNKDTDNDKTTSKPTSKPASILKGKSGSKNETVGTKLDFTTFEDSAWNRMAPTKQTQIENYRHEKALLINVHMTHHGGTYFCSVIGRNGINGAVAPAFACAGDKDNIMPNRCNISNDVPFCNSLQEIHSGGNMFPWNKEETGLFVEAIRPYFHMISMEYLRPFLVRGRSFDSPDWDHPNMVSVVVTRDPMSRLLAGDGKINRLYPGFPDGQMNRSQWWDYAGYYNGYNTDNFFLRILTGIKIPMRPRTHAEKGIEKTPEELQELFPTGINETHFKYGKSLLQKFTVVLDLECLTEGLETLGRLLKLNLPPRGKRKAHYKLHPSPKERIGHEDVYEYLVNKNKWDIALYEYSKTISLVRCEDLVAPPPI